MSILIAEIRTRWLHAGSRVIDNAARGDPLELTGAEIFSIT